MQEAVELARLVVNKTIVPERKGRGRRGYGRRPAVRLLVYAQLVGIHKDEPLEKYLRENPGIARALALEGIPDRTTIGRWRRRLEPVVRESKRVLSNRLYTDKTSMKTDLRKAYRKRQFSAGKMFKYLCP